MTRHDSYSCALDLLAFTNHGEASINYGDIKITANKIVIDWPPNL